jgi:uncharacterized FlaG/YvyC family protein
MNAEAVSSVLAQKKSTELEALKSSAKSFTNTKETPKKENNSMETQLIYDKASGLLQNVISNAVSDKVIRKIPTDEYLQLLALTKGGVDQRI